MKKRKVFRIVISVALALVFALAFSACGGGGGGAAPPSEPAPAPAPADKPSGGDDGGSAAADAKYTIGFNQWGSGAEVFDWQSDAAKYVIQDVYGMTLNNVSDEFTPDGTLKNIQNFVSAGVDGIVMACNQPAVLPQAANTILQGQIPFVLTIMVGEPDQRADLAANNPYYQGAIQGSEYTEGYMIGKQAIADGCKTAILVMGNFGELTSEDRISGFTKAFVDEGGGEILDIARTASPPESQAASSAMLAANRDADCIFGGVGDYAPGIISSMETLEISTDDMIVYVNKAGGPTSDYIRQGKIKYATGGEDLLVPLSMALMVNALDGHPILDGSGNPVDLQVKPFAVTKQNIEQYYNLYFGYTSTGKHALSPDTLNSLLWRNNPNVSYQSFMDFCDGLSLDKLDAQTW